MRLALVLAAAALLVSCQPDPETPPPKSCEELAADWEQLTMDITDDLGAVCSRDEDCVYIGGTLPHPTCDCAPYLPEVALNARRVTLELTTLQRRYELLCGDRQVCDRGMPTVSCVGGECVLGRRSCLAPDAGP